MTTSINDCIVLQGRRTKLWKPRHKYNLWKGWKVSCLVICDGQMFSEDEHIEPRSSQCTNAQYSIQKTYCLVTANRGALVSSSRQCLSLQIRAEVIRLGVRANERPWLLRFSFGQIHKCVCTFRHVFSRDIFTLKKIVPPSKVLKTYSICDDRREGRKGKGRNKGERKGDRREGGREEKGKKEWEKRKLTYIWKLTILSNITSWLRMAWHIS